MKEITIQDFIHLEDAIYFLEVLLADVLFTTDEVDGEIKFINGSWRVGVTLNNRPKELFG